MRLMRYIEIERMTRKRSTNAPMAEARGYGYGVWHAALRDLVADIDPKRLEKEMPTVAIGKPIVTAGPDAVARRVQRQVEFAALVDEDGDIGPGHVACELENEEWRVLIARLFKMVARPKAETPEIAAAEKVAQEKDTQLEAANRRVRELEQELAKSQSSAAASSATPAT
jgi:hypothetical protein